jgi:hypothetical protein
MVLARSMNEGARIGLSSSTVFRSKSWEEVERAKSDLIARHSPLEEVKRHKIAETYDTKIQNPRCKVPWTLHFLF